MRLATKEDLPAFETMLRACLLEQEVRGSPVRLTLRTLSVYRDLAHAYVTGSRMGVLVLDEAGFALAGEDTGPSLFDTSLGKLLVVWLVWVDPTHRKQRTALSMLSFGRPEVLKMGFETAVMSVLEANDEARKLVTAFGAHFVESIHHFHLQEEPHGERAAEHQ